jgi:type VI secretion system protein
MAFAVLLAGLAGCGAVNKLLGRTPTTTLSSVRVAAPPGANLNSAVQLDIVFLYDAASAAMLPKTSPEWFGQKVALLNGLGQAIDVVHLEVPPAQVIDPVTLPRRAGKAVGVYAYANYLTKEGQARAALTRFHRAVVWLGATQVSVTEQ